MKPGMTEQDGEDLNEKTRLMQEAGGLLDSNELGLRSCRFLVIP